MWMTEVPFRMKTETQRERAGQDLTAPGSRWWFPFLPLNQERKTWFTFLVFIPGTLFFPVFREQVISATLWFSKYLQGEQIYRRCCIVKNQCRRYSEKLAWKHDLKISFNVTCVSSHCTSTLKPMHWLSPINPVIFFHSCKCLFLLTQCSTSGSLCCFLWHMEQTTERKQAIQCLHAASHLKDQWVIHLCKLSLAYSNFNLNASKITLLRCLYDNNLSIALLGFWSNYWSACKCNKWQPRCPPLLCLSQVLR